MAKAQTHIAISMFEEEQTPTIQIQEASFKLTQHLNTYFEN